MSEAERASADIPSSPIDFARVEVERARGGPNDPRVTPLGARGTGQRFKGLARSEPL